MLVASVSVGTVLLLVVAAGMAVLAIYANLIAKPRIRKQQAEEDQWQNG